MKFVVQENFSGVPFCAKLFLGSCSCRAFPSFCVFFSIYADSTATMQWLMKLWVLALLLWIPAQCQKRRKKGQRDDNQVIMYEAKSLICPLEIMFLVDSSEKAALTLFEQQKQFVLGFSTRLVRIDSPGWRVRLRLAVLQYSSTVSVEHNFRDWQDLDVFQSRVSSMALIGHGTYSAYAITNATMVFKQETSSSSLRVVLLMTDGEDHPRSPSSVMAAATAKQNGIRMFTIRLSGAPEQGAMGMKLRSMASIPAQQHMFSLSDSQLEDRLFQERSHKIHSFYILKGERGPRGSSGPPGENGLGLPGPKVSCRVFLLINQCYLQSVLFIYLFISGQQREPGQGERGYEGPKGSRGAPGLGIKGDKGNTGVPGLPGMLGFPGPGLQGEKGERGPIGPSGPRGPSGLGTAGSKGDQGFPGEPGAPGERGMGEPGSKGEPGPEGAAGIPGIPGEDGAVGAKNCHVVFLQGDRGERGSRGLPGSPGPIGPPGAKVGEQKLGINSYPGSVGSPGPVGAPGMGILGPKGNKGSAGSVGPPGQKGEGSPGPQGQPGPPGLQGETGPEGRGLPGPKGFPGQPGPSGPHGLPGKGLPGPKPVDLTVPLSLFQGEPGFQGPMGLRGLPGDGLPGEKGDQGKPGDRRKKGEQGDAGAPGSPGPSGTLGEKGGPGLTSHSYWTVCVCCSGCGVKCRGSPLELVFVIDSSESVGPENLEMVKDFVNALIDQMTVSWEASRVGVVLYSHEGMVVVNLQQQLSQQAIRDAVRGMPYLGEGTFTGTAIRQATQLFQASRLGVRKMALVFTDGQTDPKDSVPLNEAVAAAHADGIKTIAVGVRSKRKPLFEEFLAEIKTIASDPDEDHIYLVEDFRSLHTLESDILKHICDEGYVIRTTSPPNDVFPPEQTPAHPSFLSPGGGCSQPLDPGPCRLYRVRWYFDPQANSCAQFWYGGCHGNQNNFETEEICRKACVFT
uniref:Collagen type XXVIII alpha 1 chain n=1 Tax=Oryzias latipes TaxID=8090 RepID=A0A3P9L7L4_ORYLA